MSCDYWLPCRAKHVSLWGGFKMKFRAEIELWKPEISATTLSIHCSLAIPWSFWALSQPPENHCIRLLHLYLFLCLLLKNVFASRYPGPGVHQQHTLCGGVTFSTLHIFSLWIFHALLVTKLPVPERRLSPLWEASGCSSAALSAFAADWALPRSWPSHEPHCAVKGETEKAYTSSVQRSFTKCTELNLGLKDRPFISETARNVLEIGQLPWII